MRFVFILLLVIFYSSCVAAEDANGKSEEPEIERIPTIITCSGPLNVDYNNNIAILNNDVFVEDKYGNIWADKIKLIFSEDKKKIERIEAFGNVEIKQEDKVATCEEAIFIMESRTVVLTGDPVVKRGTDIIAGEKITFYIDENRMVCEPGAKLVIFPKRDKDSSEISIF
ncbi:MAG: LptA/OstA family protein [Candidatus Auribacterota bacterium]|nr:LptA/OstA family protein [Candidatus Auribacterota bacterium]